MGAGMNPSSASSQGTWLQDVVALWTQPWLKAFSIAPHNLDQPILPGWTFGPVLNVNEVNSSAPQTEVQVVQRYSYGRQLGRISDALSVIIAHEGLSSDERLRDFVEMKKEIDTIKQDMSIDRVSQLRADLAALKSDRPGEYRELREALRELLDED
jgi:hypothetical protein